MSEKLQFKLTNDGQRYVALLDGTEVGFAGVDLVGSDGLRLKHTEISPAYGGRGFAGQLVQHVLEDAKRRGLGVIPVCSYAAAYVKKRPELMEYVLESHRDTLGR